MASGDTKTEALLNILGNGGSGDEYKGCCNTKTQQYILDAIDRINNLSPGGGAIKTLTDADAKGEYEGVKYVELWTLPSGIYVKDANTNFDVAYALEEGAPSIMVTMDLPAIFLVYNNDDDYVASITQTADTIAYVATDSSGNIVEPLVPFGNIFSGTDGDNSGIAGLVPAPASTDFGKFLSAAGVWENVPGGSAVKTLTTADYNYPVNNPNGISPGFLDEGFYQVEDDNVYVYAPSRAKNFQRDLFFVFRTDGNGAKRAICIRPDAEASLSTHIVTIYGYDASTGSNYSFETKNLADEYELSTVRTIVKTVAPTTSTVGEVGQFYLDTANTKLYICLSAQGGIYTWHEVTLS